MPVADLEVASSVVGIISPVISAIILALVTYLIRTYLPKSVTQEVEKSVNEAESEIKKEIQNGITTRLDHISSKVDPDYVTPTEHGPGVVSEAPVVVDKSVPAVSTETNETPFNVPQK